MTLKLQHLERKSPTAGAEARRPPVDLAVTDVPPADSRECAALRV